VDYFTTFTTVFGPLAWTFFIIQIVLAVAGVYLGFVRADAHQVRGPALKRLGYALLALGGIGVVLGALRLAAVPPFTARYWFYILAILEIALAFFVAFYSRTTYQEQMAAASRSRQPGARSAARSTARAAQGPRAPQAPRRAVETRHNDEGMPVIAAEPVSMSKRRDSRRDRKRRKR
jgi:hypothetical protein